MLTSELLYFAHYIDELVEGEALPPRAQLTAEGVASKPVFRATVDCALRNGVLHRGQHKVLYRSNVRWPINDASGLRAWCTPQLDETKQPERYLYVVRWRKSRAHSGRTRYTLRASNARRWHDRYHQAGYVVTAARIPIALGAEERLDWAPGRKPKQVP